MRLCLPIILFMAIFVSTLFSQSEDNFVNLINNSEKPILIEIARLAGVSVSGKESIESLRESILKARKTPSKSEEILTEEVSSDSTPPLLEKEESESENLSEEKETQKRDANYNREKPNTKSAKGDLILKHADIVQRYETEEGEDIIHLSGSVSLKVSGYTVFANDIIYSMDTAEVFGVGDVVIDDGATHAEGEWFALNRDTEEGALYQGRAFLAEQNLHVKGRVIKFSDEKFFIEDGYFTTSSISPASYKFNASKIIIWEKKSIFANNISFEIGNQHFYWLPFFFSKSMSFKIPGFTHSMGTNLTDGAYLQNSISFDNFLGLSHRLHMDVYQRRGIALRDYASASGDWGSINLEMLGAWARDMYYFTVPSGTGLSNTGGTRYVNYDIETLEAGTSLRWKFKTTGTYHLTTANSNRLGSVSWTYGNMKDLFYATDFERGLPHFSLNTELDRFRDQTKDSFSSRSAEGRPATSFSLSSHGVNLGGIWNYRNVNNASLTNNRHHNLSVLPVLSGYTLPSISYSLSGVLNPTKQYEKFKLNIGYSLSASYSHELKYVEHNSLYLTTNTNLTSITFEQIEEDYNKLKDVEFERDNLSLALSLNRGFSFLDFSSLSFSGGVNYASRSTKPNKSENARTKYVDDLVGDRNSSGTHTYLNTGFSIKAPFERLDENIKKRITPALSLSASHSINYKIADYYREDEIYGAFAGHSAGISAAASFTGYGIFAIPNSTFSLSIGGLGLSYDLRPRFNYASQTNSSLQAYTNFPAPFTEEWYEDESAFRRLGVGALSASVAFSISSYFSAHYNFAYDLPRKLEYERQISLGTDLEEDSFTNYISVNNYSLSGSVPLDFEKAFFTFFPKLEEKFKYKDTLGFSGSLNLGFSGDFNNYANGAFTLGMNFNIVIKDIFTLSFSGGSRNRSWYRYIPYYAESRGELPVNFFEDLGNSFNFSEPEARSASLFKMDNFSATFSHDLDGWVLTGGFAVTWREIAPINSVKAYYWDKQLYITIKIKDGQFSQLDFPKQSFDLNDELVEELQEAPR